jgi:hypothetical protein
MVGVDNEFRFLFNRFKNQINNNLVKTEELLDYILDSNNNHKYIKNFLKKKSNDNYNLTNFDIIVKKLSKMSHKQSIVEKLQKIAFDIVYCFKQTTNEQNNFKLASGKFAPKEPHLYIKDVPWFKQWYKENYIKYIDDTLF